MATQGLRMAAQLEERLVLACARTSVDTNIAAQIRALASLPLDWDAVVLLAARHGLAPLLYQHLSAVAAELVPEEAQATLLDLARFVTQQNMRLTHDLLRALDALAAAEVPAIPYKGPLLALQAYGNLALRPFSDLDVLIKPEDLVRARDVLLVQGYAPLPEPPGYRFGLGHTRQYHEYSLVSSDERVRFELQWAVIQQPFAFPAAIEQWWVRATPRLVSGRPVLQLPVEETLLLLCVHGAKHVWEQLIWVCDVAELLRGAQLSWPRLLNSAEEQGVQRMLLLGVHLAHELLGAPLPAVALHRCAADPEMARLADEAVAFMFRADAQHDDVLERRNLFLLQALDRTRDRLRLCVKYGGRLFNPIALYRRHGLAPLRYLLGR
jgi:hypothetical protein